VSGVIGIGRETFWGCTSNSGGGERFQQTGDECERPGGVLYEGERVPRHLKGREAKCCLSRAAVKQQEADPIHSSHRARSRCGSCGGEGNDAIASESRLDLIEEFVTRVRLQKRGGSEERGAHWSSAKLQELDGFRGEELPDADGVGCVGRGGNLG
jgi:hypothetical protein